MLSITPMISLMRDDDCGIAAIVPTAPDTTSPPRTAASLAAPAKRVACTAASAEFFTLVASSVSAADVSCRLLAEVSVRCDRSPPPEPMVSIASRTCDSRRNDCAVKKRRDAHRRQRQQHHRHAQRARHAAQAGGGLGLVQRDHQIPVGALHRLRLEQLGGTGQLHLQRRGRLGQRRQRIRRQRDRHVRHGLEHQLGVRMRDHLAIARHHEGQARRRWIHRRRHFAHAIQGHRAAQRAGRLAIAHQRRGERYVRHTGRRIAVGLGGGQLAGGDGRLVPGAGGS
ncbi:hypothetical protein LMG10661_02514 [Ralstonia syzygii subsp. syzygii]|nr:hypothetical protein LMG10661_02514 [Ralstonia syzygii subsp. syzygii]